MQWLVRLLTFGLPFLVFPWADDPWNEPKELLWLAGCWGLILIGFFRNTLIWNRWTNQWASWLAGWVLFTGLWHFYWPYINRPPGATQVVYNFHQWIPTIYVLTAFLAIRVLSAWFNTPIIIAWITRWMCLSAIAVAIYAACQGFGVEQFFHANYVVASPSRAMGVAFGNAGTTAIWLATLLPLFFCFQGWRWMVALGLLVIVIFYLPYRSAWAVAGVGLGMYAFLRLRQRVRFQRTLLILMFLFILGGGWVFGHLSTRDERWPVWSETVYQWQHSNRPWTGMGLQSFPDKFERQVNTLRPQTQQAMHPTRWWTPMNEWLQTLYELGLVGVVFMGLFLFTLFHQGWRLVNTPVYAAWYAVGIALLISSTIFFGCHYAPTAWQMIVTTAILSRPTEGVV